MKKIITYLLLFTFSTMLLKPAMPYVTDVLAHSFWYANHMSTVHFENGKYHIHKEAIDIAKKTNQEKNTTLLKSFYSQDIFLATSCTYLPFLVADKSIHFASHTSQLNTIYSGCDFPPPKA
jgi:hypothetical protein